MTIQQVWEEEGEIYLDNLQENLHNSNQCQKCQMQDFTEMQYKLENLKVATTSASKTWHRECMSTVNLAVQLQDS